MAAGTAAAVVALLALAGPSTAAMGGNNTPVDPASLTPPVPAEFNATCFDIGNHVSCSLAFSDPDVVNEPSGLVCGTTELLFSQTRSVVGTRLYTADGLLLQRHFIETLNGNFTNPVTGKVALWTQHDTVIHNLAIPGDASSGTEHVSGLVTRVFSPGGGTIMSDTGTQVIADAGEGEPLSQSAHHPFFDYFALGDTTAIARSATQSTDDTHTPRRLGLRPAHAVQTASGTLNSPPRSNTRSVGRPDSRRRAPRAPEGRAASPASMINIPLIGYLLHCLMTRAWRGSLEASGSSVSHRLPSTRRVALIWPA